MITKNITLGKLTTFFNSTLNPAASGDKPSGFSTTGGRFRGSKFLNTNKLIIAGVVLLILLGVFFWIRNFTAGSGNNASGSSNTRTEGATKQQAINKPFSFSIKDDKGNEVSKLGFLVENSELRDQIIIKGRRATAPSDKTFLVVNLKITNDYNKNIQISTRDYIRLVRNNNEKELLAPEVHNDPVDVQATSTKFTRVAFVISRSDKNLKLRVGEINQEKTVIDLKY